MSTAFLPNTYVTVLDTAEVGDDNGDPMANDVPAIEHCPAFWGQRSQRTWIAAEGRHTVTRLVQVRLRPGTAVTEDNRLRNERTGDVIMIRAIDRESTLGVAGDVLVTGVAIQR